MIHEARAVERAVVPGAGDGKGGIQVYRTAIRCAQNEDLKEEWEKYLEQTENHERILQDVCTSFGLDPNKETPGRLVVRHIGQSLVKAMEMALKSGPPEAAELVAASASSIPNQATNWELTAGHREALRDSKKVLKDPHDDAGSGIRHLSPRGRARELWIHRWA